MGFVLVFIKIGHCSPWILEKAKMMSTNTSLAGILDRKISISQRKPLSRDFQVCYFTEISTLLLVGTNWGFFVVSVDTKMLHAPNAAMISEEMCEAWRKTNSVPLHVFRKGASRPTNRTTLSAQVQSCRSYTVSDREKWEMPRSNLREDLRSDK